LIDNRLLKLGHVPLSLLSYSVQFYVGFPLHCDEQLRLLFTWRFAKLGLLRFQLFQKGTLNRLDLLIEIELPLINGLLHLRIATKPLCNEIKIDYGNAIGGGGSKLITTREYYGDRNYEQRQEVFHRMIPFKSTLASQRPASRKTTRCLDPRPDQDFSDFHVATLVL
jgi:hypothetical protein